MEPIRIDTDPETLASGARTRPGARTKQERMLDMIAALAVDAEAGGSEEIRRRRRVLLRGFRAAFWVCQSNASVEEMAQLLREELFYRGQRK